MSTKPPASRSVAAKKAVASKAAAKKAAAKKPAAQKPTTKSAAAKRAAARRAAPSQPVQSAQLAQPAQSARAPEAAAKAAPASHAAKPDLFGAMPGLGMPGMAEMLAQMPWMQPILDGGGSSATANPMAMMGGVSLAPDALLAAQQQYVSEATGLWNQWLGAAGMPGAAPAAAPAAPIKDRRFAAKDWSENAGAAYTVQMYLLQARTLMQLADSLSGDAKPKARVRFAVQQWIDAMSPSNFLALNPEAQRKALESQGESVVTGLQHLWHDIQQGHVSQTDESLFEVGRNVATTEGSVVFENEFFQLIEYKPLTATVHDKPILFVPPCINKYYILDLQPANSFIRYCVAEGHRTFVVSWRNADESMVACTWDDYIEKAAIEAIARVQDITGAPQINTLGFCVGGTILATALAVLAARGEHPAASMTLLTTFVDFTDTGVLDLFIDEAMVQWRELTLGAQAPTGPGLLKGQELATTFSFLRPNDLVWNYVVGNYLKGETPPPFDLLYWNSDSTNLPGPMYCWYLRHTYLQNELRQPGKLTVCGEKLDLRAIRAPIYLYASREDHIVPWEGAYRSTGVFNAPMRFMLGASGHIAGVINPPAAGKRCHWVNDELPKKAQDWFAGATETPGSWWGDWAEWLASHAGRQVAAPRRPGSADYPVIEPAPGRYVKAKA